MKNDWIDRQIQQEWADLLDLLLELEERFLYINFLFALKKYGGGGKKWQSKKKEKTEVRKRLTFGLN